jgi:pyruvate/2-oxoglutarate dehydrogenase complex dihydrolipoamide acyltransferase (E2) component
MTNNVLMPALSPTMEEGTLSKWLVKEGDDVHSGDVIAEIETDKATMEVEAVDEGKVLKLVVSEGTENVKVNDVIAIIGEEGEDIPGTDASSDASGKKADKADATDKTEKDEKPKETKKSKDSKASEDTGDSK